MNLSGKELSEGALSLLSKGMKFSLSQKQIPKEEIIAKVESSMKGIDRPEADNIRAKVSLTLKQAQTKHNISKAERRALNELKKDKDITILPADKGRATVILSKVDYIKKCKEHIESGPYETLKRDPTESIKRECLKKAKKSKRSKYN